MATKTTTTTTATAEKKAKPVTTMGWTAGTRYAAVSDKMQADKLAKLLDEVMTEYKALKRYADEAGYTKSDSDDTPAPVTALPVSYELSAHLIEAYKDDKKVVKASMTYRTRTAKKDGEVVIRRDIVKLIVKVNAGTYGSTLGESGELVTDAYKHTADIAYAKDSCAAFTKWAAGLGIAGQKVAKAMLQLARKGVKAVNALRADLEAIAADEGLATVEGYDVKVKPAAKVKAVAAD